MENKEEILRALETIKNVCKSYPGCLGCPFEQDESCGIQNRVPQDWRIKSNEPWRAFED